MDRVYRITGITAVAIAAVFLFLFDIGNDTKDNARGILLQETDIQYSIALQLPQGGESAAASLRGKAEWDDLTATRTFRTALPELYNPKTFLPVEPHDIFARYVRKSKDPDFAENTLYLNLQLSSKHNRDGKVLLLKAAGIYCSELKKFGITAHPLPATLKTIKPSPSVRIYFAVTGLIKVAVSVIFLSLLLTGTIIFRVFKQEKLPAAAIIRSCLLMVAGFALLLTGFNAAPFVFLLCWISAMLLIFRSLRHADPSGETPVVLKRTAWTLMTVFLLGISGLFFSRWQFFTRPVFASAPDTDISFYREIRILPPPENHFKQVYPYPPVALPQTTLFKTAIIRDHIPASNRAAYAMALQYYLYPCQIYLGTGNILEKGKLYFMLHSYAAPFLDGKTGSYEEQMNLLRKSDKLSGLQQMFAGSLNKYAAMAAKEGFTVVPAGEDGRFLPWPPPDKGIRQRALLSMTLLLLGGLIIWLYRRENKP